MPPRPDDAELGLRLAVAAERLNGQLGLVEQLRADVQRLTAELTAHRLQVEPVIAAHGRWLAGLEREQTEAAAEGVTAAQRADIARKAEAEARAKLRAELLTWAARILIPLALGGAGLGGYYASQPDSAVHAEPAQEASGGP